ncbi:MAG TPA: hypothetical protein VLZ75_04380 [Chitinophagales bacterium]|nr:hypothetical protein [Chitinophagales bacterium]
MSIWYNKKEEEIIQRLKNTLESQSLQFIGKFTSVEDKDFGFFKDVRSVSGVRKYYPTNEGEPDDFNNRPLEVWSKKTILFNSGKKKIILEEGKWYKFYAVPTQSQLRLKNKNPFLLQTDLSRAVDISLFRGNELIENIQQDSINTPESVKGKLTRSIEAISNEINTQPATFIFELIQNADDYPNDEKYVKMSFDIKNPYLVIKHNGSQFDVNNAVAICDINEGDKRNEVEKIGFKGIGFKSIFKDCNLAYLKSGEYSFRFDEIKWRNEGRKLFWQITPINTDEKDFRNILLPSNNVNLIIKPKEPKQLSNYKFTLLEHFKDERILLFLRNVKEIDFILNDDSFSISNTDNKWRIFKSKNILVEESIRVELNRGIALNDKRIPLKYQSIEKTEIGFGFLVNENKVQSVDDATIYAYLPTKVNLGFGFLLNGNFIPDGSRTHLHQDLTWNNYLFEKAGELFPNKLIELIESDIDTSSVLNLIPNFYKLLDVNDDEKIQFIKAFKEGFDKNITSKQFIPTKAGSLEALSNILIDETGLADLLKDEFFELTRISAKLIDNEVGEGIEKIKALISESSQGVVYGIEDLKASLKTAVFQDWLKIPSNNFRLIQHFQSSADLQSLLETEAIILSESKQLLKSSALFSDVPNEVTFLTTEKINSELLGLLTESKINLSLTEFEPVKFFKNNIVAKQVNINASLTDETNLLNFWKFIFDNWTLFEPDIAIKDSFKHFVVLCKPKTENELSKKVISSAYLSSEFNSTNDIEIVVKDISPDEVFISDKYIDKKREAEKWRKIFKQAGAITDLQKVIEVLLPKLPIIEPAKHFEIAKQIFKFWKDPANKLTDAQIALIKTNLNIKCVDKKFRKSTDCIISDHYNNNQLIASWLPNIELANQVAQEYAPRTNQVAEWKNFFALIGCVELTDKQNVFDAKIAFIVDAQDKLLLNHFQILKDISDLHKAKKENGLEFDFKTYLSQIKLQTSNGEWHLAYNIHFSNFYNPKLRLQNDQSINSILFFLNDSYQPTLIDKNFLTAIGVNDSFKFYLSNCKRSEIPNDYRQRFDSIAPYIVQNASLYKSQHRLLNHIDLNYKYLLVEYKYSEIFWTEVKKPNSKHIKFLFQESTYNCGYNGSFNVQLENFVVNFIKQNATLPNKDNNLKKPTELFSYLLSDYITDKNDLFKYDLSGIYFDNDQSKSLEDILGVQRLLSQKHCIELLSRTEYRVAPEQIPALQIVEILSDYTPDNYEKEILFLPNKNLEWKSINELFISNDEQFQLDPRQSLHEDFYSIALSFGVQELSEDNLVLITKPKTPLITDEIESFFRNKAKFIAFKIDHLNYEEVEAMIIEKINQIEFYEITSISKVFPEVKPIYKTEIAFHFEEDEDKIFYKGNWKTNSELKLYLHKHILEEKIPEAWFENVINRWDEKELSELLIGEYGSTPFDNEEEIIDNEKIFWDEYSEDEATYIKSIVNINYNQEGQLDANTTAKIKTLMLIKGDFGNSPISDEGRYLKAGNNEILVRSAQKGLLYLDLFHWERLTEDNVKIAVYTNTQINIFNSQADLFQFYKPQNKFGVLRMPDDYNLDDYNSLNNIFDKGKWHFVFIVNEDATAAKQYKEIIDLDEYNNYG